MRTTVIGLGSLLALVAGLTACGAGAGPGPGSPPPATCDPACPAGYQCTNGTCSGGDAKAISFTVSTAPVSGHLTIDGATPAAAAGGCLDWQIMLEFRTPGGTAIRTDIPCSTADGAFSVRVPQGTYDVTALVQVNGSPLDGSLFEVAHALAIP